jgi:hypothetical protein
MFEYRRGIKLIAYGRLSKMEVNDKTQHLKKLFDTDLWRIKMQTNHRCSNEHVSKRLLVNVATANMLLTSSHSAKTHV